MIRFSLTNLVAAASVTASSADSAFPATNAQKPQRPFLPWRTTATSESWLVVDFGTATALGITGLIHANFTTARIQGNATNTWGGPTYNQLLSTIQREPFTGRYHHKELTLTSPAFNFQFLRLLIPAQTPTDGASYFRLGGLWAGAAAAPPRDIRMDPRVRRMEPREDVELAGGGRQRLSLGEPLVQIRATRQAQRGGTPAGVSDELAGWLEVERQMLVQDYFLVALADADPAQAWVMRRIDDPEWTVGKAWSEGALELEELVGS